MRVARRRRQSILVLRLITGPDDTIMYNPTEMEYSRDTESPRPAVTKYTAYVDSSWRGAWCSTGLVQVQGWNCDRYTHGGIVMVFRVPSQWRRTCKRGWVLGWADYILTARAGWPRRNNGNTRLRTFVRAAPGGCGSRRRPGVRQHTSAQFSLLQQPRTCMTVCPPLLSIAIPFNLRLPQPPPATTPSSGA